MAATSSMNATSGSIPNVIGINSASVTVPPRPGSIPMTTPMAVPAISSMKLYGSAIVLIATPSMSSI